MNKYERQIRSSASRVLKKDIEDVQIYSISIEEKLAVLKDACNTFNVKLGDKAEAKLRATTAPNFTDLGALLKYSCENNEPIAN